jgi:ubiquitin C-terminal hydrolase
LADCLESYFEKETLSDIKAEKELFMLDLPRFLFINLKIFDFDINTQLRSKKNRNFFFPNSLDVEKYVFNKANQKITYKLVSKLNHCGEDVDSGHYTASILDNKKFVVFDDDQKYDEIENSFQVYILVYGCYLYFTFFFIFKKNFNF